MERSASKLSEYWRLLIKYNRVYPMDKSHDTRVYIKKRKMGDVTKDIIPYVDHGVQQKDSHQSEAISEHVKDQVEPGNVAFVGAASGTDSEVPVDAPKKHEVKISRVKKKKVNVDPSDEDFVEHVESGTSSKVPVEKEAQPSIRETCGRKKKEGAAAGESDLPNPPVRRTRCSGVKSVASKGPSPSIAEEPVLKSTSFSDVDVYLKMKPEHRFASKLQIWNNPWVIEEINSNLMPSQKALFQTTPFSHFLKMGVVKWHIALPHLALVREVHQEREEVEKWFLIRDRVVRFELEEFVLITRLSPEGSSDLNDFKLKISFKKKMFAELTIKVLQEQVRARFLAGDFDDDVDAVKKAVVYLLSHYLYGYENSKRVDNELFGFVDGDLSELRNIAFGKLLWDRTFHYMNLAFKDGDNIYYKIEMAKEEKDKVFVCVPNLVVRDSTKPESSYKKKIGGYSELVSEVFNNPEATVKDFYPVGCELKKAALQNMRFEPVYLPKKSQGFDGKFSNLEKALVCIQDDQKKILLSIKNLKNEFNIKFDEMIELLKSKKGSFVLEDCEEKAEYSCSDNIDVGGNENEFSDPPSPEKPVVSKSNLPEYDDDEAGLQLSLVREDKVVHSDLGEGREEGAYSSPLSAKNEKWESVSIPESASPAVEDETEVLDVEPLQSSVAFKRQAKPGVHFRSPFLNEFGSSEPKIQNKKDKEASTKLSFDPKELFPFVREIGKNTGPDDCGGYVKWIEGARLMKKKNNEKNAGDINHPFDFSIAQIDESLGLSFYRLVHLNVALYYLRKSILYDASVNKRVTTTCSYFDATLKGVYAEFIKAKRDLSVIRYDNMVTDYILGQYNFCFQPWIGVDDVVGSCHRKIFVFNSVKNTKTNQKKILPDLLANDISLESGPYAVPKNTPIEYEFVDKLPTQSNSDCGVFVIKYADLFSRGKINEIPPDMDEMVTHYRDDLAVTLYNYGQKKIYEGYSTEDKPKGKKSKKKKLDTVATAFSMLLCRSEKIVMPASQSVIVLGLALLESDFIFVFGTGFSFSILISIDFLGSKDKEEDQKQLKYLLEDDRSC
ncbi:hypothetical protein G4B88_001540 [Cannabis sativa]|uniref:Ubiquitin-like protease family profile domain-containing protein n=1 Tax=Cannabis sativa TaxID=3483 RepID=A0A7J6FQG8_CANSA|nr:hypothetical protein G4B88_001540 [Cannabis sativa]